MAKVSAQQVYSLISEHTLTPEQQAAVENAPIDSPSLVVAGAGSGKTELMTVRTLWLVANGFAKPNEILGLTFTKKAAAELAGRVQSALYLLRDSELWPSELEFDFEPPNISTYNSFGNEIFRQLALVVGLEADAALLGEGAAYQLARELIRKHAADIDPRILEWEKTIDHLTAAVLQMAAGITDHFCDPRRVVEEFDALSRFTLDLPKNAKGAEGYFEYTAKYLDAAKWNSLVANLASAYIAEKRKQNVVDFSDQVALAVLALDEFGNSGVSSRYRFVMLDEYQDTSAIQTRMLSGLFRNQPVMGVGDPNQAIYGWRGATSANLANFANDFGSAKVFPLSTSWRSGFAVVAAANKTAEPLAKSASFETLGTIEPVTLAAAENAPVGNVFVQVLPDEETEAREIADWLAERVNPGTSAAILVRTKAAMPILANAVSAKGLAVEVTGLGGLLETPEIIDLVSALKVIIRPEAGAQLLRILAGPRYRIGPRDLAELSRFAKKLGRLRQEVESNHPITIIEALDELLKPKASELSNLSEVALVRMQDAANLLRKLREVQGLSLTAFVEAVAKELWLDIELMSMPNLRDPLSNLNEFYQVVADYELFSERPSLEGFLTWLDYAKDRERFEAPKSGAKKGVVQILTMHSSKGLEWDFVAVPAVCKNNFPNQNKESNGWLSIGQLPWNLRSDAGSLPQWNWSSAQNQQDLKKSHEEYKELVAQRHEREETRLAYVAFTRAKKDLLISSSWFKRGTSTPREPSAFLTNLESLSTKLTFAPQPESNPLDSQPVTVSWPIDPIAQRRDELTRAAELVNSATPVPLDAEYQLLVAEVNNQRREILPELPTRLPASAIAVLYRDPALFSQVLVRPMPQSFTKATDLGTKFHANLEDAFLAGSEVDFEAFLEENPDAEQLVSAYENSRFKGLIPSHTEFEIQFPLAGFVIVCKLDAVFKNGDSFEVVDWKTGQSPKTEKELAEKAVQLALYRIALAKYENVGVEKVSASFFYVAEGKEVKPERLISESELVEFLNGIRTAHLS